MDAIRAYLERIKDIPILSQKEELEYIKKAKKGDIESRWKIINSNLKLVVNIAKHYAQYSLPLMDLIAEGNIGLMRAIDKFNPRKGYRFSTYAAWWIRQAITRALIDQGKTIRIPVYMSELISKYVKAHNVLRQKLKREPTRAEIAKKLKMPVEKIADIEMWMEKKSSLESPVGENGDSQLADFIATEGYTNTEEEIKKFFLQEQLNELLGFISEREREVLNMRFGLNERAKEYTLAEVAKKLNISRERVRQIEEIALKKLRRYAKEQQKKPLI